MTIIFLEKNKLNKPRLGVLAPLFSLPSTSGIGEFSSECETFLHILNKNGFSLWQLLPIAPINTDNSPYSALSSFGIDFIYISLGELEKEGYEVIQFGFATNSKRVDYSSVRNYKRRALLSVFEQFLLNDNDVDLHAFKRNNPWVSELGDFLAKNHVFRGSKWSTWDIQSKHKKPIEKEAEFQIWLQFIAHKQFNHIKKVANSMGIDLIGDIPFYVGYNSLEVYSNKDSFLLDNDNRPSVVGGVPPDYFSKLGQNWGNPIWNFPQLEKTNFSLFIDRIEIGRAHV